MSMSTGATSEQIEAAHRRYFDFLCTVGYEPSVEEIGNLRGMVEAHAEYLIPPDHRIIGPEQIEALRRLRRDGHHIAMRVVGEDADVVWVSRSTWDNLMTHVAELIGGGS